MSLATHTFTLTFNCTLILAQELCGTCRTGGCLMQGQNLRL